MLRTLGLPRIAYQLLPKTVLHASYGLIFNPVGVAFDYGVPDQFAPQLGRTKRATSVGMPLARSQLSRRP